MSTIHTEASLAASELEPSASGVYDYSESINDHDEKLDEGLRAPIPIHDDAYDFDTSLLSDNELEAFVKTKHYGGKSSSIPHNLQTIFQRCTGHNKWTSSIYKQTQTKSEETLKHKSQTPHSHYYHSNFKASAFSTLPQIQSSDTAILQQEESYVDDQSVLQSQNSLNHPHPILNQPEQSPFAMITPDLDESFKSRKATLPFPVSPSTTKEKERKEKEVEGAADAPECTVKELMQMVGSLTSEVINLQQNVFIKDIMIKNMYLRSKEFSHISFPHLVIERIHIVANYNNKHKYSHKYRFSNKYGPDRKRMTLSEEDSVSHGGGNAMKASNNSYTLSIKHHSTVTLEVITRWLPRYSLTSAVKKGLLFIASDDISDIDDYLIHQMYNDWNDKLKNKTINGLDKMKKDDVHKQLVNYMQHERVGLIRIEILRGKKYKKYKRIEKKFESLIIPIADIPKGDTYHILIKVHNPAASIWGPLSNMVSIKVPLKFIDDDDTDNETTKKTFKTKR